MKKNSKGFVILGLIVLCVVLTAGIYMFGQRPNDNEALQNAEDDVIDVTVSDINDTNDGISASDTQQGEPKTLDSEDSDNITLTATPEKPQPPEPPETAHRDDKQEKPTDPALTNPNAKPDSNPKPAETPKETTTNTSGESRQGQIFIPGFGWVKDEGGGGQGEQSRIDPEHADFDKIIGY